MNPHNFLKNMVREIKARVRRCLSCNTPPALPDGREAFLGKQIAEIEEEASIGSQLYDETYPAGVIRRLRALNAKLTERDRPLFNQLLECSGWDISEQAYEASCLEEKEYLSTFRE